MFKWVQKNIDRGLSWACYKDSEIIGGIGFSYLPSNDGGVAARNYGKGSVSIIVTSESGMNRTVLKKISLSAASRNEADKIVRKYIRDEGLRDMVQSAPSLSANFCA